MSWNLNLSEKFEDFFELQTFLFLKNQQATHTSVWVKKNIKNEAL